MKTFFATLAAILVAAGIILFVKSGYDATKEHERVNEELNKQGAELVKHAQERALVR